MARIYTRAEIVGILQETAAAYLKPHVFDLGDLIQVRTVVRDGEVASDDTAPGIVLAVFPDLGEITKDEDDIGVVGLRIARAYSHNPMPEIHHLPAWWFEPYTGPRPGTH